MPVPKIEDFRAPWETEAGEDAEIDKNRLKKYIHGLLTDKDRLQTNVTEVTTERDTLKKAAEEKAHEGETEAQKLKRENEALKADAAKGSDLAIENLKLQVALEKGLTAVQAKRLVGSTKEELETDADELVESFGGNGSNEEEVQPRRHPQRRHNPDDPDPDGDTPVDIQKIVDSMPRLN